MVELVLGISTQKFRCRLSVRHLILLRFDNLHKILNFLIRFGRDSFRRGGEASEAREDGLESAEALDEVGDP